MKLIVGLGNPGRLYIDSRHNIGFQVVRSLARSQGILLKKDMPAFSLAGQGRVEGQAVTLALPFTFMNLSGAAVAALLRKYKIDLNNLLVVCDDLDLQFGRIRIRALGASGGHRGLRSIIDSIKREDFCRLRLGIGRPRRNTEASEYVLARFTKTEKQKLEGIIGRACGCCRMWVSGGITESMNHFNKREQK